MTSFRETRVARVRRPQEGAREATAAQLCDEPAGAFAGDAAHFSSGKVELGSCLRRHHSIHAFSFSILIIVDDF